MWGQGGQRGRSGQRRIQGHGHAGSGRHMIIKAATAEAIGALTSTAHADGRADRCQNGPDEEFNRWQADLGTTGGGCHTASRSPAKGTRNGAARGNGTHCRRLQGEDTAPAGPGVERQTRHVQSTSRSGGDESSTRLGGGSPQQRSSAREPHHSHHEGDEHSSTAFQRHGGCFCEADVVGKVTHR